MTPSARASSLALPAALVALAALARWHGLLGESLWIDEVISVDSARRPLVASLRWTAFADVHPPGHALLLRAWMAIFGDADATLRALSLVFALHTVFLVARVAAERAGAAAAVFAGTLLAFHAGHAHFSVEVRSYALLAWWTLCWLLALERLVTAPTRRRVLIVAALGGLGLWLHHTAWIVLGAGSVAAGWAAGDRERARWAGVACAGSAAMGAAWVPIMVHQATALPSGFFAHLRGGFALEPFARVLGGWGGLQAPAAAIAGLVLFVALPFAISGARSGRDRSHAPCPDGPSPLVTLTLAVAAGVIAVVLPLGLAASGTLQGLMEVALMRGVPLGVLLVLACAAVPTGVAHLAARLRKCGIGEDRAGKLVLVATLLLALLLTLAVATGRMAQPRNLLVLVPLVCLCIGMGVGAVGRWRAPLWGLAALLLAPMPISVAQEAERVQPRPPYGDALRWLVDRQAKRVLVHSPFDAPAAAHAARALGLSDGLVRPIEEKLVLGAADALLITRRESCHEAWTAFDGKVGLLAGREQRWMRSVCVVPPRGTGQLAQ